MLNGLYSAASALNAAEVRHEAIANNLANVSTPGYRRQFVVLESNVGQQLPGGAAGSLGMHGPNVAEVVHSFEPGEYKFTDSPLDLAIAGDGFFVVESPAGRLYTRNGAFTLDENRTLVTHSGMPVLGQGGPITLPPGSDIIVQEDGTILVDGTEVGRLQIVSFQDPSKLQPAGTTLFQAPPEAGMETVTEPVIRQGYREMSNVNPVSELVNLIVSARHHEAAQRALKAISEAIAQKTNPMNT